MDLSSPGHVDLFNIFFHLLGKELLSELSAKKNRHFTEKVKCLQIVGGWGAVSYLHRSSSFSH